MKKLICLLLVLSLLLCGCGGAAEAPAPKEDLQAAVSTQAAEETQAPEETEAPEETRPLSLGLTEGNSYVNEYVGYRCDLGSAWTLYPVEVLQDIPNDVVEALKGSELGDALEGVTQITDMMAENVDELITVNVVYTKLTLQQRLAYALMDDAAIMKEVLSQRDLLISSYAQAGINVESIEEMTVTFLGQERLAMHTVATMQDVPYFILQVYDYHLGSYGVVTTFASFIDDKTESMLDLFVSLEG